MAKKKEVIEEVFEEAVLVNEVTIPASDPLEVKVKLFRGQGFDNNRIAALLGIQKSVVDGIE
jgi:hypothetical protein